MIFLESYCKKKIAEVQNKRYYYSERNTIYIIFNNNNKNISVKILHNRVVISEFQIIRTEI